MFTLAKLASIAALGTVILSGSLAPAYALKMPEGTASQEARQQRTESAYAGEDQVADGSGASILSAVEIKHIRWCAARYKLAYDAVSDTYSGSGGINYQCRSPR